MKDGNEAQGGNNNLDDNDNLNPFMGGDNSQESYNQIADDLRACLDRWRDAGICDLFAQTASLDIIADELRELLPEEDAEEVIQDIINLHDGDV